MKFLSRGAVMIVLVALLCAGCQSPRAARIQENAALFAALDPFSQQLVRDGLFDLGFSGEHVYMSLGKPDRVETVDTPLGPQEMWTYKHFMYGDARTVRFNSPGAGSRVPARGLSPAGAAASSTPMSAPTPAQPTIADMKGPALGTLTLDLRDGRVVAARIRE